MENRTVTEDQKRINLIERLIFFINDVVNMI